MQTRYLLGRAFQIMGLGVVLVGLLFGMARGFQDEGLESMKIELYGLIAGGILFYLGRFLQGGGQSSGS